MSEASPETAGADAPEQRPRVAAVVLTWNDVDLTRNCLQSLRECAYEPFEVVVVDNGSDFPVVPVIEEEFPEVDVVALPENTGFTGGCNRGMERALELGADYVFLLNNDTLVDKDAAGALVAALEERPDVGMASALLLNPETPPTVQSFTGTVQLDRAWLERPHGGQPLTDEFRVVAETEFASACAVCFPARTLRDVGMFDEALFTNWEDYDLCARIRRAGLKIIVVGTAEVRHRRHQTTGELSPFISYFSIRNRLICLRRYATLGGFVRNSPFIFKSLLWGIRGRMRGNRHSIPAYLKGIWHFLIGVRGKGGAPVSRDDSLTGKKRYGAS